MHRFLYTIAALAVLAATAIIITGPTTSSDEHCVAHVIDQLDTGEIVLSDPVCVRGDESVRAALVAQHTGTDVELAASGLGGTIRLNHNLLGIHYDGVYSGSSFSVVGDGCTGGWVNLSSSWKNRVSSTINGVCTRVKHHDLENKVGSYQSTWGGGGDLSYMDNRAKSISYEMM